MRTIRANRVPAPLVVRVGAPVAVFSVLLLTWQFVVVSGTVPPTLLPSPGQVLARLVSDLRAGVLVHRTLVTIWEAILGCALASVVALPIGYLIAHVRSAEAAFSPYLAASQAIPAVALAPLLVIWVGYGLLPIVLLCALLVFFPLVLSTTLGIRTIDDEITEAAELDGASGWSMIAHVEAPMARSAILTGIRNGFTLSITGAVVGEFVMGGKGLGMIVSVESATADTTGLFATIIVLCVLAVVIYMTMLLVENLTDPCRAAGDRVGSEPENDAEPFPHPRTLSPHIVPSDPRTADKELIA
ncbi:ABC transporter permease [Propionibacterium australiense]|uniref:ABC transporter permease subunit n=1 Tax=Propionibacterium australiense TaxID=119981 RepID=A0A383S4L4_9ACTN|nr:ABC transporter permease [Propionibacterium australiense]RLP06453.1 ABC transporter permease subunit [Propionibacterium australiense]RLP11602.1 ABC transporter permease subunit [Propionibacterium australiense]SYZ32324.1 Binding-protein-dependent transport system inner membrane component [Propionibacterium australiense]VEH90437.1 Putative aliphatic sulfonates transport permease protein ssuC [Propionibacterium australiense]